MKPVDTEFADPRIGSATIRSVQVGGPRDYVWLGRSLTSSIAKEQVLSAVAVLSTHLEGDEQADPAHHGGLDKAVYAYAADDLRWWSGRLGRPVPPGSMGENLTIEGSDLRTAVIGEQWVIGTALLQVSEPRTPCWKLGMQMDDPAFPRVFAKARRPGVMLRVLRQGSLQTGDAVHVEHTPAHGITAAEVFAAYVGERNDLGRVLGAPELAAHWRAWAEHRTIWHLDEERTRGRT